MSAAFDPLWIDDPWAVWSARRTQHNHVAGAAARYFPIVTELGELVRQAARGAAEGGGSRQLAAAVVAATIRTWRNPDAAKGVANDDDVELLDRLDAVAVPLREQIAASKAGLPAHFAKDLVDHEVNLRRNVALHGFDSSGIQFRDRSPGQLRRLQREPRKKSTARCDKASGTDDSMPDDARVQPLLDEPAELADALPAAKAEAVTKRSIGIITAGTIGGISAVKRLEDITSALRQQLVWEPCDHWQIGTLLQVRSPVLTDDKLRVELPRRLQGKVVNIDEEGHALVAFPGLVRHGLAPASCECWVLKHTMGNFSRALPT